MRTVISRRRARVGLVAACVASALGSVIVLAPPAQAELSCYSEPDTPSMIDHKLYLVDGDSRSTCNQAVYYIRATVRLYIHFTTRNEWGAVSTATTSSTNATYAYTTAYVDCAGMGPDVEFRAAGMGEYYPELRDIFAGGYQDSYWAVSGSRKLQCGSGGTQVIKP